MRVLEEQQDDVHAAAKELAIMAVTNGRNRY